MTTLAQTREGMSAHEALSKAWQPPKGFAAFSEVNHTPIGRRYLITGLCFFVIGGILALMMRTQLAVPENELFGHDTYNQLFTMHGTTMLFLFAVPILEGAAVFLLPHMIGSRDLAYPRLSAFGYWCYLLGGILLYSSILFGMMPDTGWTVYTPLSNSEFSPEKRVDFWLTGITLVEIGSVVAAAEIAVSILKSRAPGMSLNRMPLFAWYMLVVSFMILIGFPPLIMGDILLEVERSMNWPFFDASRGGHDLLWQHLFWIFGHPEVYIIFLPAAGFVSMMVATFSRRETVGYFWLVAAAVGTGFVSFGLWVHHMFATGIPMISLGWFSAASMTVSIFAGIQIFSWIATIWLGKPVLKTPMLFVLGFIFLFVAGGLSGVMHAAVPFDWQTHSSYFLIAHFHYVLVGGMVFPLFGALYYWFPLATGKMMSERLGKWNFWLLFIGFNVAFFPMHISGLKGMPRRVYTYPEGMWEWENMVSTIGAWIMAIGVLLFIYNFVVSKRRGEPAGRNPWNAGTLEWAVSGPAPHYNFRNVPQIHSRYPVWEQKDLHEEIEQGDRYLLMAENLRLGFTSGTVNGEVESIAIQPKPEYSPLISALGTTLSLVGVLIVNVWVIALGAAVAIAGLLSWSWRQANPQEEDRRRLTEELGHPLGVRVPRNFGWWGMCMAIAGDAVLFVSLVFAYFYLWSQASGWPPAGIEPASAVLPVAGVAGLLVGSVAVELGKRFLERSGALVLSLIVASVLVIAYSGAQVVMLMQHVGPPQEHAYNALVHTLIIFNLLHTGIALLMLCFAIARALSGSPGLMRHQVVFNVALFWHYVVVMSVVTCAVVYFWPRAV